MSLTAPVDDDGAPKKLVIIVDELDRCRPDYALSLLEIIKHFFDVPHVHFVLGANMRELQNSVSARYGTGIDAAMYLQKFVTLTMRLPDHLNEGRGSSTAHRYFEKIAEQMGIDPGLVSLVLKITSTVKISGTTSLRGYERLASLIAISP
ncbi:MAG: KAP family P-loop NTPase fold protein [Sulfitobacter sp.]